MHTYFLFFSRYWSFLTEGKTITKRGKFCYYDGINFEEGNEIITLDGCETCKCEDGKPVSLTSFITLKKVSIVIVFT